MGGKVLVAWPLKNYFFAASLREKTWSILNLIQPSVQAGSATVRRHQRALEQPHPAEVLADQREAHTRLWLSG